MIVEFAYSLNDFESNTSNTNVQLLKSANEQLTLALVWLPFADETCCITSV